MILVVFYIPNSRSTAHGGQLVQVSITAPSCPVGTMVDATSPQQRVQVGHQRKRQSCEALTSQLSRAEREVAAKGEPSSEGLFCHRPTGEAASSPLALRGFAGAWYARLARPLDHPFLHLPLSGTRWRPPRGTTPAVRGRSNGTSVRIIHVVYESSGLPYLKLRGKLYVLDVSV